MGRFMRVTSMRSAGMALVVGMAISGGKAEGEEPRLAEYFGFLPPEIYKLDSRISNVVVRDLDGDKVDDIAIINNGRSRIDLLLSGKAPAEPGDAAKAEANQVPSDRRMRLKSLPVNKEVVSLQAGDFDGDGKVDLAYYGTPAEVIVLFNQGKGNFGNPKKITTGEAAEGGNVLAVGDLNHDGRDDLALLAANEVVAVFQGEKGKLGEPERFPHTATKPVLVRAVDIDGDGGDDLVIWDSGEAPLKVRFSAEGGKLGPEQRFAIESPRALAFANLDGKPGSEVLTIESQSGRAKVLTLDDSDDEGDDRKGRLIFYPLPQGTTRGRSLALGDLDGDGKADVVVTDPTSAQLIVYRQGAKKGAGLGSSQTFPGLVGGRVVRAADLDGDGKAEVIILSEQEKQVARSVLEDGRLSFPAPLPIAGGGEPVALEVADLDGDKAPEILYVTRGKDEKGSDLYSLRGLKREKTGTFVPFRWGPTDAVPIPGLTGAPPAMRVVDANRDGQADILVFNAFGPPILLLGRPGEPPAPAGGSLGPLIGVTPAGVGVADLGGPALMVAQSTYARDVLLDKSGRWEVKDQFNADRASAQILGAAALDIDGDGVKEVALLDRTSKSLLFLAKKDGVYRPAGTLPVGPINDFQGLHVADLDGDGRDDLLIAATDKFGVVLTGRKGQRLKVLASYEPAREEAKLGDLAAGDLNGDGQLDVVLTDVAEHFVEIVTFAGGSELDRALSFKIFEQKSFRGEFHGALEPRDMGLGDVDGDGRTDLVLIVHDRVLIYRQDSGKEKNKAPEKTADRKD